MPDTVEWQADGTPFNPRFDDIYRSHSGGLEQARHVFMQGCGLPEAWAGQQQWRILETGFGLGLNFLAAWHAWREDPARPRMLHFAAIEAWPADPSDLIRSAAPYPELVPLAAELAAEWQGLLPGFHRFSFERGHVLLTLCVGDVKPMLRELRFEADSVFLDGFNPERNPEMWDVHTLQSVARLCRRGTGVATWTAMGTVKQALRQCGFIIKRAEGLAPKRHRLVGEFNPEWEPKRRVAAVAAVQPGRCVVIGAGLAGAAVAASLARRGWAVEVLDAFDAPAGGASGLPAGLLSPHVSPDDSLLSRLTRSGIRMTLQQARQLLEEGKDWAPAGVLEHRVDGSRGLPAQWPDKGEYWSRVGTPEHLARAGLPANAKAIWHTQGGWIKPASLVNAWLSQPGIQWRGGLQAAAVVQEVGQLRVLDEQGQQLAQAELVVIAAGPATAALAQVGSESARLPLQPVRGQVSWAPRAPEHQGMPAFPVNGGGSFIPALPTSDGPIWLAGASFERDDTDLAVRDADQAANLEKLRALLPGTAAQLEPDFNSATVQAWTGIRCASPDRLPLVGPVDTSRPGLLVSTAMGSRGLSFAALCGELLAASLHGEPMAVEHRVWERLEAARLRK
ncbi:MAG: FAD-dependent 5-carboxymethylaminomethyl-2-thiouridine(34) oxidoreductase MnmC [Pseudomonadota bacterium]